MPPLPLITPPLQHSKFNLDIFSIAGFFGGDEVIESLSTIHLYKGRRYRGWYNSPGTYQVAKSVGRIANARFWRGLFPGPWKDPATSFGLDGKRGPLYLAVLSGTKMNSTGHMGYLLSEHIKAEPVTKQLCENCPWKTKETAVSIVNIHKVNQVQVTDISEPSTPSHLLLSYFTMISSVACAVFSLILFNDRMCFAAILIGTLIGGISSLVIGMGTLSLTTVFRPASGSPPGDGVLVGEEFIVLRGSEPSVNAITKGKFELKLVGSESTNKPGETPHYHAIGFCSLLYFLQFMTQLILVPQGKLPGQIMFLVSFAVAWINNGVIASIDNEARQIQLLTKSVSMDITKYTLPNRTMAAVFTCLSLRRSKAEIDELPAYVDSNLESLLKHLLPNDTSVWNTWRGAMRDLLQTNNDLEPTDFQVDEVLCRLKCTDSRNLGDQLELLTTLSNSTKQIYDEYLDLRKTQKSC